jgi:DNA polymerase
MTKTEKVKLLKQLYQYRSMGFKYFKKYNPAQSSRVFADDFETLESSVDDCHLCNLSKTRNSVVFGGGNKGAKIMFVGEAPRSGEDESGKIFVGQAGDMLTKIIEKVLELKREDVYITNILKCKTPENRVPSIEEAGACKPYLLKQIDMIKPQIIVALGSTSFHHLTGEYDTPMSKVRGEVFSLGSAKLIPTFCPYFLLRNPSLKKDVFQDMLKVKSLL